MSFRNSLGLAFGALAMLTACDRPAASGPTSPTELSLARKLAVLPSAPIRTYDELLSTWQR